MRMFGATVVYDSFFFLIIWAKQGSIFFLGVNSRGIFQVNFDL